MRYDQSVFTEMGNKIVNARKQRHLNQEQFLELLDGHGVSIGRNRLSKMENGCRDAFNLEIVIAVCEIFEWDLGFLFGEYSEHTREAHELCSITGLTESAVTTLLEWKSSEDRRKFYPDYLSRILGAEETEDMFGCIAEYLTYHRLERDAFDNKDRDFAMELQSLQMARLWSISKVFSNIIEMKLSADEYREEDDSNGKA